MTSLTYSRRHRICRPTLATRLNAPPLVSTDTAALLDLLHVANLVPLERLRQFMGTSAEEMERRVLDAAWQRLHDLAASPSNAMEWLRARMRWSVPCWRN